MAQQHARQAHLQDIAVTFHDLFRRHSILQAWHSTAQHAKRQRLQLQQQAGEQQQEATNQAAASRFHALYVKHSSWQRWVEVVQHSKVTRELDLQHQARQQSIQRFVQASCRLLPLLLSMSRLPPYCQGLSVGWIPVTVHSTSLYCLPVSTSGKHQVTCNLSANQTHRVNPLADGCYTVLIGSAVYSIT